MHFEVAAKSDVGRVREHNEDRFLILDKLKVFAVCDGMGGHQAGAVASQSAVMVLNHFLNEKKNLDLAAIIPDLDNPFISSFGKRLVAVVRLANRYIYNTALSSPQKSGMGTTIVLLGFEGSQVYILHVGDSRAYWKFNGKLELLTRDHSWVNELLQDQEISEKEAANFQQKNVITRALGTKYAVRIDCQCLPVCNGLQFLLCSDGLSGPVKDAQIEKIINHHSSSKEIVNELITAAIHNGGPDNITAAYVRLTEVNLAAESGKPYEFTIPEESQEIQELEDRILAGEFGKEMRGKKKNLRPVILAFFIVVFLCLAVFINYREKIAEPDSVYQEQDPMIIQKPDSPAITSNPGHENGKIVFVWFNVAKRKQALVYIDREMKGTVEDYRNEGIGLAPGEHQVEIKLNGKTIFNNSLIINKNETEPINLEEY